MADPKKSLESKNAADTENLNPFQDPLDPKKKEELCSAGNSIVCSYQNSEDEAPENYLNKELLKNPEVKPSPLLQQYFNGKISELPPDFEPNSTDLAFIERHLAKLEKEKNKLLDNGKKLIPIMQKIQNLQLYSGYDRDKVALKKLQKNTNDKIGSMAERFYAIQEIIDRNENLKIKFTQILKTRDKHDFASSRRGNIDFQQTYLAVNNTPQNEKDLIATTRGTDNFAIYKKISSLARGLNINIEEDPEILTFLATNQYDKAFEVIEKKTNISDSRIKNFYLSELKLCVSQARLTNAMYEDERWLKQKVALRNSSSEEILKAEMSYLQTTDNQDLKTAYADYQKAEQEYQTYLIENEITENQAELKQADITVEPTNQTNTYTVNYEGIESEITVEAAPGGQGYIITVPDLNADNGKARAYKISDIQELNPKIKEIMQVVRIDKIWNQVLKNLRLTEQAKFINDQYISDLVRVFDLGIISDQSDLENFLTNFAQLTLPESNFSTVKKLKWFNKIISSGDENAKKELKSILLTPESIPFEKLQETIEAKNFDVVYN